MGMKFEVGSYVEIVADFRVGEVDKVIYGNADGVVLSDCCWYDNDEVRAPGALAAIAEDDRVEDVDMAVGLTAEQAARAVDGTRFIDKDGDPWVAYGGQVLCGRNREEGEPFRSPWLYEPFTFADDVSAPAHYRAGMPDGVEVIDVIRAQGGSWEHSNAIKYVLRALFKGNTAQDYRKAIQYLTWAAERAERESD